jgi:hypothetical protein
MGVGRIPPEELPRPRCFQSQGLVQVFEPWAEQAKGIEKFHVEEALLEIAGGGIWEHEDRVDTRHRAREHLPRAGGQDGTDDPAVQRVAGRGNSAAHRPFQRVAPSGALRCQSPPGNSPCQTSSRSDTCAARLGLAFVPDSGHG